MSPKQVYFYRFLHGIEKTMLHRWMGLPAETPGGSNAAFRFIYKRLRMPGILFSGMFFVSMGGTALVWTIVDGERGRPRAPPSSDRYGNVEFRQAERYRGFRETMAAGSLRYALRCCRQQGRPPLFPTVKHM